MAIIVTPTLILRIRALTFGATEDQISDDTISMILQTWIDILGDDDGNLCQIIYNSLIDVLQYLWNRDLINQGMESHGATGRQERVGEVEVKNTYSSTSIYTSPWQGIYDRYLDGSLAIAGCPFDGRGISGVVIVGGVDAREIHRVNSRLNSVNGLGRVSSVDTKYPTNRRNRYSDLMRD